MSNVINFNLKDGLPVTLEEVKEFLSKKDFSNQGTVDHYISSMISFIERQFTPGPTITIGAHCRDCCVITSSISGMEYTGYVPQDIFPDSGGDSVEFTIDIYSGKIMKWDRVKVYEFIQDQSPHEED